MALVVVALVAASSSPPAAMLLTKRMGFSVAEGSAVVSQVNEALNAGGLSFSVSPDRVAGVLKTVGLVDAAVCASKRDCVVELGRQLKVEWVIALSMMKVETDRSIGLELVRVADGMVVEKDAQLLGAKDAVRPAMFASFAEQVRRVWDAARPEPKALEPTNEPIRVLSEPALPVPVPAAAQVGPGPSVERSAVRSHSLSFVMLGLAGVSLATAAVVLISGLVQRATLLDSYQLSGAERVSTLSMAAASRLNDDANTKFVVSGLMAGLGLGCAGAAFLAW
jgi:hypothetical protein